MLWAFDGLPVDQQRNGVFCLRNTVVRLTGRDACCRTGDDAGGNGYVLKHPAADINVMGREIIAEDGDCIRPP